MSFLCKLDGSRTHFTGNYFRNLFCFRFTQEADRKRADNGNKFDNGNNIK